MGDGAWGLRCRALKVRLISRSTLALTTRNCHAVRTRCEEQLEHTHNFGARWVETELGTQFGPPRRYAARRGNRDESEPPNNIMQLHCPTDAWSV